MGCYDLEGNGGPRCVLLSPTLVRRDSSIRERGRDLTGGRNSPLYLLMSQRSLWHLLLWGKGGGAGEAEGLRLL